MTGIPATSEYTASIRWVPADPVFASATIYTAIITLTPLPRHTMSGISDHFFTVAGASAAATTVNNDGKATVTVVFPITDTTIDTAAIAGITPPKVGETPTNTIAATTEYTAAISWSPDDTLFKQTTVYTATITITPKTGYTLVGVPKNFFTAAGAHAENAASSGVVTAKFSITDTIITASALGLALPVAGAPVPESIAETAQYTGAVSWSPPDVSFAPGTVYTATITITPKNGYTLINVPENFFKAADASTGNNANQGVVTAVFPPTAATINTSDITGLTIPDIGDAPDYSVNATDQFTAAISWSPDHARFLGDVSYTATVTISPKAGYTLCGVTPNFFSVSGASSVTNDADSGIVTVVFPATNASKAITGLYASLPRGPAGWHNSSSYPGEVYYGFLHGPYVFWPYDDDNNYWRLKIICFDALTGAKVKETGIFRIRYIEGIEFDSDSVTLTGQGGDKVSTSWFSLTP